MNKKPVAFRVLSGILMPLFLSFSAWSQTFVPVTIGGFNHDVIAESGTSSLTTTTSALDGTTISNKVIYTNTFRTLNAFAGGGIPDNGTITDATGSYQLADYAANNALIIPRNGTGDIVISTPAKFDQLRILSFSTEGTSLVNATLFFADGTSTVALTNYSLNDWFNGTTNLVLSGIGRCTRATPASGADAYPDNPRMYYIDIPISCTDRQKNLERISLANVTTAGTNAPFPNAVFFAVSATSYSLNITEAITDATCINAGAVTLTITGSSAAYNVTWNTSPVQTGLTASNLAAGVYVATITDLNTCSSTDTVTIGQVNNLTIVANGDTTICYGASFTANTVSTATSYSWTPVAAVSDPTIPNPVLTPAAPFTLYTVTGTLGTCSTSVPFTVTVDPQITLTVPSVSSICPGNSIIANTVSNANSFQWTPTTGVSDPTIANPALNPSVTTPYTIIAITGNCSVTGSFTLSVTAPLSVDAGANVTIAAGHTTQLQGSADIGTYSWTPATGLNATNVLNPIASPDVSTTYTLTVTNSLGCTGFDTVRVDVVPECGKPMNAITPNGDGINDRWLVSFGNCQSIAAVKVYNRSGSAVYESDNYQNSWEGTFRGKPLPDGTYYYVIEYRLNNGRTLLRKGDVTILR